MIEEFEWGEVVVRQQVEEEGEYRRMELLGKYTAKLLYGWDDQRFKEEYLNKLEKNWKRWKEDRQIDESEHLKRVEEKIEEENEKIRGRDWRTGHFSGGEILRGGNVKIVDGELCFYFSLFTLFDFSFSIVRTTWVRVYQSRCHISHKLMV